MTTPTAHNLNKEQLEQAAKNLLDTEAFFIVYRNYMLDLTRTTMEATDDESTLAAKHNYSALEDFYGWLTALAQGQSHE